MTSVGGRLDEMNMVDTKHSACVREVKSAPTELVGAKFRD